MEHSASKNTAFALGGPVEVIGGDGSVMRIEKTTGGYHVILQGAGGRVRSEGFFTQKCLDQLACLIRGV